MLLLMLMLPPIATPAWAQEPAVDEARLKRNEPWDYFFGVYNFNPPHDDAYQAITLGADHGALHLEARYSYEALYATSFFVGRNFEWTGEIAGTATPMIGLLFGDSGGVVPGLEVEAAWHELTLSVEAEYVFDLSGQDDSFFYTWNELVWSSSTGLNLGLVAQRSRAYQQDLDVERGLVVGIGRGSISLNGYWFNPDRDDSYWVVSLGGSQ